MPEQTNGEKKISKLDFHKQKKKIWSEKLESTSSSHGDENQESKQKNRKNTNTNKMKKNH